MLRREFLRKGAIIGIGGLLVGDAALEALDRLTHRKVWTGAELKRPLTATDVLRLRDQHGRRWMYGPIIWGPTIITRYPSVSPPLA